ncbi:Gamma-tubulin complex component 2 [Phytophthora cinnamomi]|uniref:Gamma-tubulin complex component 2 n=1 Tax=Phytophthora cinnamomi TaxID=4785 RepID=UPI003559483C|nr:Gamma-tubulin complex component 2 [Phytophthora cinnamomi]
MAHPDEPPPPPPPPLATDARGRSSLASKPAGAGPLRVGGRAPTFSELRAGGFSARASSCSGAFPATAALHVATDAPKDDDPLSPRTRLEMEKQRQQLAADKALNASGAHTSNTTPTNHSSTRSTPRSASFYSVSSSLEFNPATQLSPHRAMLSRVDSLLGAQPVGGLAPSASSSQYAGASFGAHSMYSASTSSVSPLMASAARPFQRGEEQREPSSCGAEILYNAPVRLRLSSRQCLRISALKDGNQQHQAASHLPPRPTAPGAPAGGSAGIARARPSTTAQIDVSGDGLDGDDDQIFVLQNTALRSDCAAVHYSDVVSLYCVGGSCKGQFLSVDAATQTLTTKKGPVVSNSEKWRLVNPVADMREDFAGGNQDSFVSVDAASRLWGQQKAIATSDRVMLKMNTADLYLAVRPSRYGHNGSSDPATVVLSKENDGINDTVQIWKVTKSNLPYDPEWNRERPYLTGEAFVQPQARRHHATDDCDLNLAPLSTYPPSVQESIIVDDLLYVLLGVEGRLESLLHLSLQTSTCSSDPYKDDLQCFLSPHNLISHMEAIHQRAQKRVRDSLTTFESSSIGHPGYKVIDAFTLDYNVKWPLSLVISCGALTKYQMIFRHIFFCKHVERQLCDAWLNHQATKELSLRSALGPSFCLRQRMLHFQQNFVYYMMFEVISPRWHDFQQQFATAETVDDILEFQGEFLDICLKECLLTDPDLLRVLTKLMTVCMTFANSIERFTRPYFLDEETIKAEREAERDRRAEKRAREEAEVALASYQRQKGTFGGKKKGGVLRRRQSSQVDMRRTRIKELSDDVERALTEGDKENPFVRMTNDLENQFDSLLGEFMQQLLRRSLLQQNSHLSNLCTRLDYNGFYTK